MWYCRCDLFSFPILLELRTYRTVKTVIFATCHLLGISQFWFNDSKE